MICAELRPASDFMAAVLAEQQRPRLVTVEDGHFCVHHPEMYANTYDIPVSDCSDRDGLLRWLRQLSEKTWVTTQVIEDFSKAAIKHFGVRG